MTNRIMELTEKLTSEISNYMLENKVELKEMAFLQGAVFGDLIAKFLLGYAETVKMSATQRRQFIKSYLKDLENNIYQTRYIPRSKTNAPRERNF